MKKVGQAVKKQNFPIFLASSVCALSIFAYSFLHLLVSPEHILILVFGSIFSTALLVLFLIKPEMIIYFIAFFLPVINWNFNLGSMVIPFIDLVSLIGLVSYAIKIFFNKKDWANINLPFFGAFTLFYLSSILSSFLSPSFFDSWWYGVRWILFSYLAYFVLPSNIIKTKKHLSTAVLWFVISALLIAVMGFMGVLEQDWLHSLVRAKPVLLFGAYPIGENQNLIAETLLPGIFLLMAYRLGVYDSVVRRVLNIVLIFLLFVLLGTFSKAGWLSLAFAGIIYIIYSNKNNLKKIILPLAATLAVLVPFYYQMYLLQSKYDVGVSSTNSRIHLAKIGWEAFKEKPFFGQGPGEYINKVAENIRFRASFGTPFDSHGIVQKILAENGLVGMVLFMFYVGAVYSYLKKIFKKYNSKFLFLLLLASFSVMFFELFNNSYYKGKLWFVIALAFTGAKLLDKDQIWKKRLV